MKKKWVPKLRHPWAQSAAGFTLVELIVVIAILGVLAGVGTVGYSGYVKNAQKKADQTLVANIVRAIETGTKSTMFAPPASLSVSATQYPVGFIVLNHNGTSQVLTSNSDFVQNVTGECDIKPIEINYIRETEIPLDCANEPSKRTAYKPVYEVVTETITCCLNHSGFVSKESGTESDIVTTLPTAYKDSGTKKENKVCGQTTYTCEGHEWVPESTLTVKAGTKNFIQDESKIYELSATSGMCELAYANQTGSFVRPEPDEGEDVQYTRVNGNHALNQAIEAAFGSQNLLLQYDGWGKDEDKIHDYSTFYTYAPTLMTNIQTLGQTLLDWQWLGDTLDLSQTYQSTDQMVTKFAKILVSRFPTPDTWETEWMNAKDGPIKNGFGVSGGDDSGREIYSAARVGYNSAFVSYMEANDASETCINVINNYVEGFNAELGLPLTVCDAAFIDTSNNGLQKKFGSDTAAFEECKKLYDAYKTSDVCRKNGRTFYETMVTINDTAAEASDPNNAAGGYFEYYDNYLEEMAGIYSEALELAGNGIMIIVTSENNVVKCEVSPSSADLRKQ